MSLSSLRSRASQRVVGASCALHRIPSAPVSATIHRPLASGNRLPVCPRTLSWRYLSTGSNATDSDQDLFRPSKPTSIEDIRLKNEFAENNDIREYLRKWQKTHPSLLDPVRGPGTSNELDEAAPWVGNMMNDNRETHEAMSDPVRAAGEDMSDFSTEIESGGATRDFLEPGDLVGLRSADGVLNLAIYVRSICKQQQFYTARGKWRIAFASDIDYIVKGFAPPTLVTPLGVYFPNGVAELSSQMQTAIEGGLPRSAGADLLEMLRNFDEQADVLYQANAYRLDRIHEIVSDEDERLGFTIEELACEALGIEKEQLDDAILFTVHSAASRNPFLIEKDRSSPFSDHYIVQPKRITKTLNTVTAWVHEHQEYLIRSVTGKDVPNFKDHPLQQFIQKAQRLIRLSRKVRAPTTMACAGPSAQRFEPGQDGQPTVYREVLTEEFSSTDRTIIEYLQLWCLPPRRMTSGPMRSAGSHIMRTTGMYNALDLSSRSAALFLQELGVMAPWENLKVLDQDLALPGHGISKRSDAWWADVQKACEERSTEVLTDKMRGVRTDWGDMPVYCVDDVGAQELDDGVSLERIPGSDDTFWVRVHVANPSAFVEHDDIVMKHAASQTQSLYIPERTYPMIPKSLTQAHFSLATGRPTLTFSAKMNLQGDILETDVTNGIVRNVIYLTHDKLRSVFGVTAQHLDTLIVGGEMPSNRGRDNLRETLSSEDKETFHTFRKLMLAFSEHRRKNGAMEYPYTVDVPVSMSVGTSALTPYNLAVTQGHYFLGDPIIQLRPCQTDPHEILDPTKHNLISTLMNLACWVSGKWCEERNIPTVYDGTFYHPEYPKLTNENMSEYGGKSWLHLSSPTSVSSSSPLPHVPLGLSVYAKATSPLRRFTDMITHYQIEAALRFEHEHGRRMDANTDGASLPFSREDVDDFIYRSAWKQSRIRDISKSSSEFWACMLLFRAFYFGECALPESFTCLLHKPSSTTSLVGTQFGEGYTGVITELGIRCQVLTEEVADVDILSVVEAKIKAVDLSRNLVIMEATRLVKPFERIGEWA